MAQILLADKDDGMAFLAKRLKQKNPKVVEETYQYYAKIFSFPPRVQQEAVPKFVWNRLRRMVLTRVAGVCPSARRPPIPAFVADAGVSNS
jgi:hypothetical protein